MVIICVSITKEEKRLNVTVVVLVACVSVHKRQKETECGCQYCMSAFYEGINNKVCINKFYARIYMFTVQGLVVGRGNVHSERR